MDKQSLRLSKVSLIMLILTASAIVYASISHFVHSRRPKNAPSQTTKLADVNAILKRGKLVALTDNSTTSYFIYKGEPMGFEYELLNKFANYLGVELEVVIAKDMNTLLDVLNSGEVDIIAANLTNTYERSKMVAFTEPLMYVRQMLIQRKPENWWNLSQLELEKKLIRDQGKLAGKEVHVRKESTFFTRLKSLSEEIGEEIIVKEAPGNFETEELISMVANGFIDYTVADENVGLLNQTYYDNIDANTALSFPQKIAWAVRKDCPKLLMLLNNWIGKQQNKAEYAMVYNKYFKNKKGAIDRMNSRYSSLGGGKISIYDEIFKRYSKKIGWDWRLLAAMVCQESRFDSSALSWAGACGLMQIIPATASRYGIDTICPSPEQSVRAGTDYIMNIDDYWKQYIPSEQERIKFVLASYNVGLGHVIDARNLAIKFEKDPNQWDDNVAEYLLNKSKARYYQDKVVKYGYCRGEEPYKYVKEIISRYEHYKRLIDEMAILQQKSIAKR